jgi:histidinol-phosphate aminotransferase
VSIVDLARPEIRHLEPYQAAIQVTDTIRLNANEAPWTSADDPFRRPLNRYPEIRPAHLRDALAERFGAAPEQLLVTRGSSEAIDLLIRAFCRAGVDNIVTTAPTFSMYRHYAEVQGAAVRAVPTDPARDFEPDADALLAACDDQTRLVFLCSPNNPTGTLLPDTMLTRVLDERSERSVVVVDEAYVEFSTATSMVRSLDDWPNLVVLRTLSKALACAGARCGAVMGPREVIDMLNAIQAPYALSTPVVESVEDALSERWLGEATRKVAEIVAERERVRRTLDAHPLVTRVWPSAANFLLVEVQDVDRVMSASRQARVLLRYFGGDLERCIRISIGTAEENDALLAVFADLGDG